MILRRAFSFVQHCQLVLAGCLSSFQQGKIRLQNDLSGSRIGSMASLVRIGFVGAFCP